MANFDSPRAALVEMTRPYLPKGWRIVTSETALDVQSGTVVRFALRKVSRLSAAPLGAYDYEFSASVVTPFSSPDEKTEDRLEDDLHTFLSSLDDSHVSWTEAEKVLDSQTQTYAWDITLHLIIQRETN